MKTLRLLIPVLLLSLLTGCSGRWIYSDYREIDQMELIQALGMDEKGEEITVTASTGGPDGQVVLRSTSVSVSRAMRQMQDYTSRKYIFSGTRPICSWEKRRRSRGWRNTCSTWNAARRCA